MKRILAAMGVALIATSAMAAKPAATTKSKTSMAVSEKALWTTTGAIVSVSGKGLDAATAKSIRQQTLSNQVCMSRNPSAAEIRAAIGAVYGKCDFPRFNLTSGSIRAAMRCGGAYGTMTSDFVGLRGASSYTGTNTAQFASAGRQIVVRSVIGGKITGNC